MGLEGDVVQATILGLNPVPQIGFIGFTWNIVEEMHPLLAEGRDFAFGLDAHKDLIIRHARDLRKQGADIMVLTSELDRSANANGAACAAPFALAREIAPATP